MNQMGLDNTVLPFSGVNKEIVIKAIEYLNQIRKLILEDRKLSS